MNWQANSLRRRYSVTATDVAVIVHIRVPIGTSRTKDLTLFLTERQGRGYVHDKIILTFKNGKRLPKYQSHLVSYIH